MPTIPVASTRSNLRVYLCLKYVSFCSYGVALKELGAEAEARQMFLRSVHLTPLLWASWQELAKLCEDRDMVSICNHIH